MSRFRPGFACWTARPPGAHEMYQEDGCMAEYDLPICHPEHAMSIANDHQVPPEPVPGDDPTPDQSPTPDDNPVPDHNPVGENNKPKG